MEKLIFNPKNAKYYSEEFIKGFECGVERQFNADTAEKTAEWLLNPDDMAGTGYFICSNCENDVYETTDYCPNCGAKMKEVE